MVPIIAFMILASAQPNSLRSGYALYSSESPKAACCSSMAQFVSDPAFLAAHFTPKAPNQQIKLTGHIINFSVATGKAGRGYFIPSNKGNHVAIMMFHEYWGLNENMEQTAQTLHNDTGYEVILPDLYDGQVTDEPKKAGDLMAKNDEERSAAIIVGAFDALESGHFGPKPTHIGTIGYCFGGGWSERAAIIGSKLVQACVVYYGMPDTRPQSLDRLQAPVLMFQGLQDHWITQKVVDDFKTAMANAHKSLQVFAYDAPHAFANPSNPKYDASGAADAYKKELAFFKKHL